MSDVTKKQLLSKGGYTMIKMDQHGLSLVGPKGSIRVNEYDEITRKLGMLYEGLCEGIGATKAARKFGYTRQRYYQLLRLFKESGAEALKSCKSGPKENYRRTDEAVRQIIRHRFLDSQVSPEVIAQKLVQCGHPIAMRSVQRVISEYGLQKKTPHLLSGKNTGRN